MKGITYCGACADYDRKKHRCRRGPSLESRPQDKFYDDCPLADVVPVVRCRECKYWGDEAGVTVRTDGVRFARCKVHNLCVSGKKIGWCPTEDDFCSQGERRDGNENR